MPVFTVNLTQTESVVPVVDAALEYQQLALRREVEAKHLLQQRANESMVYAPLENTQLLAN